MDIFEQLKRDEGSRFKPYRDSRGKLTIGIGRNLDDVGLFQKEIEFLLANDVAFAEAGVNVNLPWSAQLDEPRRMVLVNMCFNMGVTKLLGFVHFLASAKAGEYAKAAEEMLNSAWALQVGPRAIRLSKQMESGEWQ
jgi:lysozyme